MKYSNGLLFADDVQTYLSSKRNDIKYSLIKINNDLKSISQWSVRNRLILNEEKTQCIVVDDNQLEYNAYPPIKMNSVCVPYKTIVRNIGLIFNEKLSWYNQINSLKKRVIY